MNSIYLLKKHEFLLIIELFSMVLLCMSCSAKASTDVFNTATPISVTPSTEMAISTITPTIKPPTTEFSKFHFLMGRELDADWISAVAWSPDSKKLVISGIIAGQEGLYEYNANTLQMIWYTPSVSYSNLAYSPDGKTIIALDVGGDIYKSIVIWDAYTGQEVGSLSGAHHYYVEFTSNPQSIVVGSSREGNNGYETKIYSFDIDSKIKFDMLEHEGWLMSLSGTVDDYLAIGLSKLQGEQEKEQVILWNAKLQQQLCSLKGVTAVISANSQTVATIQRDGTIILWAVHGCSEILTFQAMPGSKMALNSDGQFLVFEDNKQDTQIQLWDIYHNQFVQSLDCPYKNKTELFFSPNNHYLMVICDSRESTNTQAKLMLYEASE